MPSRRSGRVYPSKGVDTALIQEAVSSGIIPLQRAILHDDDLSNVAKLAWCYLLEELGWAGSVRPVKTVTDDGQWLAIALHVAPVDVINALRELEQKGLISLDVSED